MHFAILDVEEKEDDHGSFVSYGISINGGHHSSLRYRQLRELHEQLKRDFGADRVPQRFPPKKLLSLNQTQIEERRELLEKYLQSVSQDPELVSSQTFVKFLLKAQKENHKVKEEGVKLDVYLMNGKKFQVDVKNTDCTAHVMKEAMAQIKLPEEMIKNFALFLMQVEEDGELSVVRKLQEFESPCLILLAYKSNHQLVIRKSFWKSDIEDELYTDKTALNLLFVQAVSDIEREWIITTKEVMKELNALKAQNNRKKYLNLARNQKFYGYIQFKPCLMDFPESDTQVLINVGGFELNFRLLQPEKTRGKQGSFKVTRIKCWRVLSSRNAEDGEVVTKIAFQYLLSKEKLQWITITSDQAMLMSLCLQSMVDEIIKEKAKASGSKIIKPSTAGTQSSKERPTKEQPAKLANQEQRINTQEQDSHSSDSTEVTITQKNDIKESKKSSEKDKKKDKKHRKNIATVKNEIFAQDIGDDDL